MRKMLRRIRWKLTCLWADESGMGVVEVILIIVENQRHPNLMCFV